MGNKWRSRLLFMIQSFNEWLWSNWPKYLVLRPVYEEDHQVVEAYFLVVTWDMPSKRIHHILTNSSTRQQWQETKSPSIQAPFNYISRRKSGCRICHGWAPYACWTASNWHPVERMEGNTHLVGYVPEDRICVVCSTPAKLRQTNFVCIGCSDMPHLHPKECFVSYHTIVWTVWTWTIVHVNVLNQICRPTTSNFEIKGTLDKFFFLFFIFMREKDCTHTLFINVYFVNN